MNLVPLCYRFTKLTGRTRGHNIPSIDRHTEETIQHIHTNVYAHVKQTTRRKYRDIIIQAKTEELKKVSSIPVGKGCNTISSYQVRL